MAFSITGAVAATTWLVLGAACRPVPPTAVPKALLDGPEVPLVWGEAGESPKEGYRLTFAEYDVTRIGWTDVSWSSNPNIWGRRGQLQQRMSSA